MSPGKKAIRIQIAQLMAHLTLDERLEMAAIEMDNLEKLTVAEPFKRSAFEDIEDREYDRAKQKATGNWEPPDDPDAWAGGFADNH